MFFKHFVVHFLLGSSMFLYTAHNFTFHKSSWQQQNYSYMYYMLCNYWYNKFIHSDFQRCLWLGVSARSVVTGNGWRQTLWRHWVRDTGTQCSSVLSQTHGHSVFISVESETWALSVHQCWVRDMGTQCSSVLSQTHGHSVFISVESETWALSVHQCWVRDMGTQCSSVLSQRHGHSVFISVESDTWALSVHQCWVRDMGTQCSSVLSQRHGHSVFISVESETQALSVHQCCRVFELDAPCAIVAFNSSLSHSITHAVRHVSHRQFYQFGCQNWSFSSAEVIPHNGYTHRPTSMPN